MTFFCCALCGAHFLQPPENYMPRNDKQNMSNAFIIFIVGKIKVYAVLFCRG
jgi:hypothetical protein